MREASGPAGNLVVDLPADLEFVLGLHEATAVGMATKALAAEKNASARNVTPAKNSGQVRTARIAPKRPERARISSRSPMDFIAAAVRISPMLDARMMAAIMPDAGVRAVRRAVLLY